MIFIEVDMKKVVIIGAGPAGLTAAYELLKNSQEYEVIILESSNQVGGISKTIEYHGNRMDLGGHRFFTKSPQVMNIWRELLPIQGKPAYDDKILNTEKNFLVNGADPFKTDDVFLIRNRVSRIYYLKKFFDYPITLSFKTIKNLGFINTIEAGFSYLKSCFIKRKEDSLENFYINRFGKKLYQMFFYEYTKKLWGRDPSDIDASWGSQRVKGLSIKKVLKDAILKVFHLKNKEQETSLIEEFYYPKYGPGQLYEKMATYIENHGGKIYYNHEVIGLHSQGKKIKALTCLVNGNKEMITGDIFISSMPIKDLITSLKAPKNIQKIANGLPYRDFITIGLLVKNLKIKNNTKIKTLHDIIPDCWIYVQEKNIKLGRIQIFNNWSPYLVKDIDKSVFLGLEYFCQENDDFWKQSDESLKELAIQELLKMDLIEEDSVLDFHVERVKKAYPAYFDTYKDFSTLKTYLNKIPNLYCIGRNGQHRYNNMDHSMLTAILAAKQIINHENNKDILWKVNTESSYHEVKK